VRAEERPCRPPFLLQRLLGEEAACHEAVRIHVEGMMTANDLKVGGFFTTNGSDVWKLESYFDGPSCTLRNLETQEVQTFGMNGLTAEEFRKLVPA
jgi:hypothetical protein